MPTIGTNYLDSEWAKRTFMVSTDNIADSEIATNRYWSTADSAFMDTRIGSAICLNPLPQITPYSDIRSKGRLHTRNDVSITNAIGNHGLGNYYNETYNDNAQIIFIRAGVPQYNSIFNFLSRAFDPNALSITSTGRATTMWYDMAKAAARVGIILAAPGIALPIQLAKFASSLFIRPTHRYFTLKPDMKTLWLTVHQLVNDWVIKSGLLPKALANDSGQVMSRPFAVPSTNDNLLDFYQALLPDVFPDRKIGEGIYIDVAAIASRAQRMANRQFMADYEKMQSVGSASDFAGYVRDQQYGITHPTHLTNSDGSFKWGTVLNRLATLSTWKSDGDGSTMMDLDPRIDPATGKERTGNTWFENYLSSLDADFRDGSQFVALRVEHTGSVSESVANSTQESEIARKMNEKSADMRQIRFNMADGNLIGGVAGDIVGATVGVLKDIAMGAADGATFNLASAVMGLAGGGYIDIQKYWHSSSVSLPTGRYTVKLISPGNDIFSRIQNIAIPLFTIMALGFPRATGKASYGSPPILELYDRGHVQIRTGIMRSISIQRGTSHLPFDTRGKALAIDVSFEIEDLSSMVAMPVTAGLLDAVDMSIDEDNILSDYIACLAGQDMYSQMYAFEKIRIRLAKLTLGLETITSPHVMALLSHDSLTNGLLRYTGVGPILEGMSRGSAAVMARSQ